MPIISYRKSQMIIQFIHDETIDSQFIVCKKAL